MYQFSYSTYKCQLQHIVMMTPIPHSLPFLHSCPLPSLIFFHSPIHPSPHLPFLSFSFFSVYLPHLFSPTILSTPSFTSLLSLSLAFLSISLFPSHHPFFSPSYPSYLFHFTYHFCAHNPSLHPSILFLSLPS